MTKQTLTKPSTPNAPLSGAPPTWSCVGQSGGPTRRARQALLAVLLLGGLVSGCARAGAPTGLPPAATTPPAVATQPASADLTAVLTRALEEEHGAKATYDNMVAAFGPVPPFLAIARAEAQHIAELESVAAANRVAVSTTAAPGQPAPATRAAACAAGVAAEQADVQLYDELIPQVQAYPDVVQVLEGLRAASQANHLPAFERCA